VAAESDNGLMLKAAGLMYQPYIENFQATRPLLETVLARSPDNFVALAQQAVCHTGELLAGYRPISPEDKALALASAQRAVRLNNTSDFCQYVLGWALFCCERDYQGAEAALLRSLDLNPNYAFATFGYGMMLAVAGDIEDGIARCTRVIDADPRLQFLALASQYGAIAHFRAKRYGEAIHWARQSDSRQADMARTLLVLAAASALAGDEETTKQAANRMMVRYPDFHIADFGNWPFRDPEPAERLIEGLRLAGLPE
ncbi:MAG: hypothetical protein QGF53_04715, partial [Alphaproteobacteria bacterium]|nr:hypothetical protein [Alphaproteobacteria bacterium]